MNSLYSDLAASFSSSREHMNQGWDELTRLEFKSPFTVLDVGCGNGRFFGFLKQNFASFDYLGIDGSAELLKLAKSKTNGNFRELDLLNLSKLEELPNENYDLVGIYALMHHIPKIDYRKSLLEQLASKVAPGGYLHVSFWQFGSNPRYENRKHFSAKLVGMEESGLERNDYILDWRREGIAYRFCHYADDAEVTMYQGLISDKGFVLIKDYLADGKEGNQNRYLLMQRVN